MNRSEQINDIAAAMAKAQAQIEGAVKDKTNPAFKGEGKKDGTKYADLGAVWDAIREPLSSNGLSIVQGLERSTSGVACETLLMHTSGQWISSRFEVPVSKQDAQGFGSAATYCRRYSLQAMTGIAPIDDDGNGAVGMPPAKVKKSQESPLPTEAAFDVIATEISPEALVQALADAKAKADEGTTAFRAMWKLLTDENRDALRPYLSDLQARAIKADDAAQTKETEAAQ